MDTTDLIRTKRDKEIRKKRYQQDPAIRKEVESISQALTEQVVKSAPQISDEMALLGFCLLIRRGDKLMVVNPDKFTVGFKNE